METPARPDPRSSSCPLFVDLDGTLVRSDTFLDTLPALLRHRPWLGLAYVYWLLTGGLARLKQELALRLVPDPAGWPYVPALLEWLGEQRAAGRTIILATASDQRVARAVADHTGLFDDILASDGTRNRRAAAKLEAIRARVGSGPFAYAGNSRDDLVLWAEAAQCIVVNASAGVKAELGRRGITAHTLIDDRRPGPAALWRALRVYQWSKNLLLAVPLVLAHRMLDGAALLAALQAMAAFCLAASAVYLVNDLLDVFADRSHSRKRERPLARGDLAVPRALAVALGLLAASAGLALALPAPFAGWLLVYLLATAAYSLVLKQVLLVDVILLALLYLLRIVAGAAAIAVPVTPWLLGFSLFFFLSLAFTKRYGELLEKRRLRQDSAAGRGYHVDDLEQLAIFGAASGYLSVLVLALYIHSPETAVLYGHSLWLWLVCPVILWWLSRIWILVRRGVLRDDPLLFALKDPGSWAAGLLAALLLLMAV
jgi:4-hydroxybenzoate polyprenyltransferase